MPDRMQAMSARLSHTNSTFFRSRTVIRSVSLSSGRRAWRAVESHCIPRNVNIVDGPSSSSSVRGMPKCVQSRSGTLVNLVYLLSVM